MSRELEIVSVTARWISVPIPSEQQHVSDFGRMRSFDMALVEVETRGGLRGYGEAKGSVGSAGECATLVTCLQHELGPRLIGCDARNITAAWERLYNGNRDHYALSRGRGFPALGRRGAHIAALGALDTALWDILGKAHALPIVQFLGGSCHEQLPCYASGGWATADSIGAQLHGYVDQGFAAVKMRIGVMDGSVMASVERVHNARQALGPDVDIMVDAHGTFSTAEAKRFAAEVESCGLRWFEEPVNSDQPVAAAEVRASTSIPIAMGESEFTRFDIARLIELRAVDVLQPDCAIIGGITEAQRIATLAHTHQLELAPHLWGSALSFMAGLHVAFAAPAAVTLEYSLGANPLLHDLVEETPKPQAGKLCAPSKPGLGVTVRPEFIQEYTVTQ